MRADRTHPRPCSPPSPVRSGRHRRRRRQADLSGRALQRLRPGRGLGAPRSPASRPARSPTSTSPPQKTALVTFEVGPEFPELKANATCSSEPQSLIAEYFVDCQPGSSDQPLEGPIPAARNQTTVQNDLVNNVLREPFKRRFQLIINEFGTALVGNPENLNAAIRAGAPALRELRKVLKILGRQNTLIAQLNVDSDVIFEQLTDRREDVVRFIDEAEDTARISAERRADLAARLRPPRRLPLRAAPGDGPARQARARADAAAHGPLPRRPRA